MIEDPFQPPEKLSFRRKWFARSGDLRNSKEAQWGIHWYTPVSIIALMTLGIASAVAHHLFYSRINGTGAGSERRQQFMTLVGTSLAFLCKASLGAVIGISRMQCIWVTLRTDYITLRGIDALFGVTSDLFYFKNWDMVRKARLATTMAAIMWIFPFTAVFTPGAIVVATIPLIHNVPCDVRTLVFEFTPKPTAERLCCDKLGANVTFVGLAKYEETTHTIERASVVTRVMRLAAFSGNISHPSNLIHGTGTPAHLMSLDQQSERLSFACGRNCTYTLKFVAPAISCTPITSWKTTIWNSSEEYMQDTRYLAKPDESSELLWVGYIPEVLESGEMRDPIVQKCQSSIAYYTVRMDILDYNYLEPTIEAVDHVLLTPTSIPEFPATEYLPNTALLGVVRSLLEGNLTAGYHRNSDVTLTHLFSHPDDIPVDLGVRIEQMAQKMMVSILSFDSEGTVVSPLLKYAARETNTCRTTNYLVAFQYQAWRLLVVYGAAISTALCMAVLGFVALAKNGVACTGSVSVFLRASRNPTLDEKMGSCLGGGPMSKDLRDLELKFGELASGRGRDDGVGGVRRHIAMGTRSDEVTKIVRSVTYT
ncbi:hypothetical protein Q9L58_006390 [Maublancomyces gigas]|uniref:Uncharacterized protein n=1 Tax=Discina gigas TaxID=1032678 RepID=A0ABR3GFF5_9PEZI